MTPEELGKGPVDEEMKQRVHAIAQEAYRRRSEQTHPGHPIDAPTVVLAIEIALSGWTPPEPVDPDVLAFREWAAGQWPPAANYLYQRGLADNGREAQAFLAGVRWAREQESERFNHPVAFAVRVMAGAFKDLDSAKREAREALARIPGRA